MGHFCYVKWPEGIFKGSRFGRLDAELFQHISKDAVPSQETESAESIYVPVCTYEMCYMCYYHHYYGYPDFTIAILMIMHASIHSKLYAICLNHLKSSDLGMNPPYYYIGMYVWYIYIHCIS